MLVLPRETFLSTLILIECTLDRYIKLKLYEENEDIDCDEHLKLKLLFPFHLMDSVLTWPKFIVNEIKQINICEYYFFNSILTSIFTEEPQEHSEFLTFTYILTVDS